MLWIPAITLVHDKTNLWPFSYQNVYILVDLVLLCTDFILWVCVQGIYYPFCVLGELSYFVQRILSVCFNNSSADWRRACDVFFNAVACLISDWNYEYVTVKMAITFPYFLNIYYFSLCSQTWFSDPSIKLQSNLLQWPPLLSYSQTCFSDPPLLSYSQTCFSDPLY